MDRGQRNQLTIMSGIKCVDLNAMLLFSMTLCVNTADKCFTDKLPPMIELKQIGNCNLLHPSFVHGIRNT